MKTRTFILLILLATAVAVSASDKLYLERLYQPVILQSGPLYDLRGIPLDQLYLYAFDENGGWRMMPFQFDQRRRAEDPFKEGDTTAWRHSYFLEEDGILDEEDELVFLVRDLGDQAPDYVWIEDADSRSHPRLELVFTDPTAPGVKGYAYLYRSATITEPVPTPYSFSYNSDQDRVETHCYSVAMSKEDGLIRDILIKPPFGNGVDFFDTQKFRFSGIIDNGTFPIYMVTNESVFYLYDYRKVTPKPVVRLIREVRETIKLGSDPQDDVAFYVTTKFYPFSGTIDGGEKLDVESLHNAFPDADLYINFKYLRQSWDFNQAASGMRFFSKRNQDVLVDGVKDAIDTTVTLPVREWTLLSGSQGSFFTYTQFPDTVAQTMGLYYWDSQTGAPRDSAEVELEDSGDNMSYGDHGLYFKNVASLRLGFTAYFLPANRSKSDAEKLSDAIAHPLQCQGRMVDYPTAVESTSRSGPWQFDLGQNYPNPFNNTTAIRFQLDRRGLVSLRVVDRSGRTVTQLLHQVMDAGTHELSWNGRDQNNREIASGIYFYELSAGAQIARKTMVLLK